MKKLKRFLENARDCIRWLWRRDSESAAIMIIIVTNDLNPKDVRQMREYLECIEKYQLNP